MWFTWSHWILFIRKKVVQTYMFQNTWFDCSSQWASISREKISLRISGFLPSFSCCSGSSLTTSPFLTFASRSSIDFSSFFKFLNFFWGSTEVGGALPVFGWLKRKGNKTLTFVVRFYLIFTSDIAFSRGAVVVGAELFFFFLDFAFEAAGTIGRESEEERPGMEEEAGAEAEAGAIPGM